MIDTIRLRLSAGQYFINEPYNFSPTLAVLKSKPVKESATLFKSYRNPTRSEKMAGNYMPRLTYISPRTPCGRMHFLMVEFSAPKLLYGNNFDELEETDFRQVIKVLQEKLKKMGIKVNQAVLAGASVSTVHYSKNIPITDFTSVSMLLKEMRKVGLSGRLDLSELECRNGGHLLRCHANTFETVFYDKIKDLQQGKLSEKRAVEKDNYCQMSLLDAIEGVHPLEVIRMEVRLGKKQKIRSVFKAIGIDKDCTSFRDIFKKETSQKVLLHFWDKFDKDMGYAKYDSSNPYDVLAELVKIDPTLKSSKLLKWLGLLWLIQKGGSREAQDILGLKGKKSSYWYRLQKEMEVLSKIKYSGKYKSLQQIPDAIKIFEPLKLKDFLI